VEKISATMDALQINICIGMDLVQQPVRFLQSLLFKELKVLQQEGSVISLVKLTNSYIGTELARKSVSLH